MMTDCHKSAVTFDLYCHQTWCNASSLSSYLNEHNVNNGVNDFQQIMKLNVCVLSNVDTKTNHNL